MAWTPWGNVDLIPGVNVGNAVKQVTTGQDQDIFSGITNSNRPGQMQINGNYDIGVRTPQVGGVSTPTPNPAPENISGNSGVTGSDGNWYPSAAAAQSADRARTTQNLQTTQQGYQDAASQQSTDVRNKYQSDVQKFLATIQNGQDDINGGKANTALNLKRSMSSIAGGIRQGIKSGGVQLANMNATDSGAADAMARAYATMGNQQAGDANNEAALKFNEFDVNQVKLNRDKDEGVQGFDQTRDAEVNRIRGDLRNKLAALDASGAAQGVNGVVNMGIVDAVINQAVQQLAAVDSMRNQRLGGVQALDANAVNARAAEMDQAGMEGTSPFATPEAITMGGQQQLPGADISQLPLYARPKDDQAVVA